MLIRSPRPDDAEVLADLHLATWRETYADHFPLEANPRARAFYVKNGFAPDGARQPSGFDGAPDEIRMVR